jgi:hypothetical protein
MGYLNNNDDLNKAIIKVTLYVDTQINNLQQQIDKCCDKVPPTPTGPVKPIKQPIRYNQPLYNPNPSPKPKPSPCVPSWSVEKYSFHYGKCNKKVVDNHQWKPSDRRAYE